MKEVLCVYKIGDTVRPRSEWIGDPNNIPSGRIVQIEPRGDEGAIYVEGKRRALAAYKFELESSVSNCSK